MRIPIRMQCLPSSQFTRAEPCDLKRLILVGSIFESWQFRQNSKDEFFNKEAKFQFLRVMTSITFLSWYRMNTKCKFNQEIRKPYKRKQYDSNFIYILKFHLLLEEFASKGAKSILTFRDKEDFIAILALFRRYRNFVMRFPRTLKCDFYQI